MLSHTCKTAIKSVIYLASRKETESRAGIREIASSIEASEHTVGKILQALAKEGIIHSAKGPTGGFYITKAQMSQPLLSVVEAIDGKDVFRKCGLGLSRCSSSHPCPIHDEYKIIRDRFEQLCLNNKLSDLCKPVNSGMAYLFG